MADKAINFFNPGDVLSLANGWVQQEDNITDTVQRAQGLGATGDEAASQTHGGSSAGTVTYENHSDSGNLVLPKPGAVLGGYHVDSFSLAYSPTGWPRLTINVHQHDSNSHATGDLNTFTPSLTCPAGFGVPRALGISNLDASAGVRSCNYTVGCTHLDEDQNGDHWAGENRDGVETLDYEFTTGTAGLGDLFEGPAGWDELSDGSTKTNTSAENSSMQWTNHIGRD